MVGVAESTPTGPPRYWVAQGPAVARHPEASSAAVVAVLMPASTGWAEPWKVRAVASQRVLVPVQVQVAGPVALPLPELAQEP